MMTDVGVRRCSTDVGVRRCSCWLLVLPFSSSKPPRSSYVTCTCVVGTCEGSACGCQCVGGALGGMKEEVRLGERKTCLAVAELGACSPLQDLRKRRK